MHGPAVGLGSSAEGCCETPLKPHSSVLGRRVSPQMKQNKKIARVGCGKAGNPDEDGDRVVQGLRAGGGCGDSASSTTAGASGHNGTTGTARRVQCQAAARGPEPIGAWKPPGCVSPAPSLH